MLLCRKPYMAGAIPFGCGQCLPCRINRRRQWAARQYLESLTHENSAFVTLTYADEPRSSGGRGTLVPRDVQLFLKRLRSRKGGVLRFFACGEYGEVSQRPHYHLALFGLSGRELYGTGLRRFVTGERLVAECWPHGFVSVGEFTEASAQYVAKYTVKRMTHSSDPRLDGRHPEFARMSLRPGIGVPAMKIIADTLSKSEHGDVLDDVPSELKVGRRSLPLGRTLLRKLREACGYTEEYIESLKARVSSERSLELLALFQADEDDSEVRTIRSAYAKSVEQKILQLEAKSKIYESKRSL